MRPKLFSQWFINGLLVFMAILFLGFSLNNRLMSMQRIERELDERMWRVMYSILDRMVTVDNLQQVVEIYADRDMKEALERLVKNYNDSGQLPKTLDPMKQQYPELDFFILDENYTVVQATKKDEIGLELGKDLAFSEVMDGYKSKPRYYNPRIGQSVLDGTLNKYSYYPTADGRYTFEAGNSMSGFQGFLNNNSFANFKTSFSLTEKEILQLRLMSLSGSSFSGDYNILNDPDIKKREALDNAKKQRKIVQYNSETSMFGARTTYLYATYFFNRDFSFNGGLSLELSYTDESHRIEIYKGIAMDILIIFGVMIVLLSVNVYYSRKFIQPLRNVLDTIDLVKQDQFSARTHVISTNEIGVLATSIDSMLAHIELLIEENNMIHKGQMDQLARMVTGVAHEMNTPIGNSITTVTYLERLNEDIRKSIKDESLSKQRLEQYLEEFAEGQRLTLNNLMKTAQMIERFKTLAVSQGTDDWIEIPIHEYIDLIVLGFKEKLSSVTAVIENRCNSQLTVMTCPTELSQVITNLLFNSLQHGASAQEDIQITIDCLVQEHDWYLIYTDNGRGMNEESLLRQYEPFYSTNKSSGSAGLGMTIVYNVITQRFKGEINCQSALGEGVRFVMRLPMNKY